MKKNSIMVVEDEAIVAEDLRLRLSAMGYEVPETMGSSEEAISRVEALSPDLILMDIVLEGSSMDGIETARAILSRIDVPIIFVTAFADDATLDRAKTADPFAYILKPFNERELYSAIELALHKHRYETEIKKRDAILFAISFSVEWYLRYLHESRDAIENPSDVKESGTLEILEHIRIAANATSVGIFRLNPDSNGSGDASIQFISVEPGAHRIGFSPGTKSAVLNFSTALWKFLLASGQAIAGDVKKLPDSERKFFEEQGILSVAILPIFKNGSLWGFVSYADKANREWSEGEIEGLLTAGNIIGAVLD
ncbi:MAG: response regulator [Methanoregula sp.]|nr:response regulator [Methanoregula sp.]